MKKTIATVAAILSASPAFAVDAVDNAYSLCRMLDGTGLTSSKCEVSGWSSTVTTTIDMSSDEARKLCAQISESVADKGMVFGGWTLNIKSPYSGGNNIAFCTLR